MVAAQPAPAPPAAFRSLELPAIAPADVGMDRIGHFGFFRPTSRAALWDGVLRAELVLR
jgi:hypothetical protein